MLSGAEGGDRAADPVAAYDVIPRIFRQLEIFPRPGDQFFADETHEAVGCFKVGAPGTLAVQHEDHRQPDHFFSREVVEKGPRQATACVVAAVEQEYRVRAGGRPIDMDCDNGFGSPEPDFLL